MFTNIDALLVNKNLLSNLINTPEQIIERIEKR